MKDPYDLLGLEPGASAHEVKKAFRRLAMRWHPDRNPDPAAVEHFKRLRAAYETLIGAHSRPRHEEEAAPEPAAGGTETDTEAETGAPGEDSAGAQPEGSDESRPRGEDRHEDLTLDIEEACCGGTIEVTLEDAAPCNACGGSGEEKLRHTRLCTHCHGSGRVRTRQGLALCPHCRGRGYRTTQACSACGGTGSRRAAHRQEVMVPAGVLDGDEIRLARAGHPFAGDGDGEAGDLVLHVRLAGHGLYRLDGRDLRLTRPVSALRLLIGGEIEVPLPQGLRRVALQPGSALPRTLRIAGAGFPGRGGQDDGDLFIEIVPVMPQDVDDELRPLLQQIDTLLSRKHSRHLPDVALWEDRWLGDRPREA